ncbi:MAG: hypothetical protein AAGA18_03270 [Verrucomicrobiota bacterium]
MPKPHFSFHSTKTKIPTSVDALYHFHLEPKNIPLISPSFLKLKSIDVNQQKTPHIKLCVSIFGIAQYWEVNWGSNKKPSISEPDAASIQDIASKLPFPFTSWIHTHQFIKSENTNQSYLTDTIQYDIKGGPLKYLLFPFIEIGFRILFRYRHQATINYFAKNT